MNCTGVMVAPVPEAQVPVFTPVAVDEARDGVRGHERDTLVHVQ